MKVLLLTFLIAYNPINLVRSLNLQFKYPTRIPTEFPDSSKRLRIEIEKNRNNSYDVVIKQSRPCDLDDCIVGRFVGTRRVLPKKGSTTTLRNGHTAHYLDCFNCLSSLTWVEGGTNYQIVYFINEEKYQDRLKELKAIANSSLD